MTDMAAAEPKGVLGWIERVGNKLPDPIFIFLGLILVLVAGSALAEALGLSIAHPVLRDASGAPEIVTAQSLLAPENLRKLLVEMPQTFTRFAPLGYVLVVMLGAGVAERSGLYSTAMRAAVRITPRALMTPAVIFVCIMSHLAADAGFVVLVPLAGALFAAAGRNPLVGIAVAFASVGGGFSANLLPGQLDALLFGLTESAARTIDPHWSANIAGNWYFIVAMTFVFLPVIWAVTDLVIEPRLGKFYVPDPGATQLVEENAVLTAAQKRGLLWAGLACLAVIVLWAFFLLGPNPPLYDATAEAEQRMTPFYQSLIAGFFVLFLAAGWAYGAAAGTIQSHRDVVRMMAEAMGALRYYFVLAFAAAHFVAMFTWSNLGIIFAVKGALALQAAHLPPPILIGALVLISLVGDLFIGSASAKWALMAPVMVPMFMLIGISPEMTTAAYRAGGSVANIVTPLFVYFPLTLGFCQRWRPSYGLGSLSATMTPYFLTLTIAGLALAMGWTALNLPLGPGAGITYTLSR